MGTGTMGPAYPRGPARHAVIGSYAGLGATGWITNAKSVQDLAGRFHNININVAVGPIRGSLQIAWRNGTFIIAVSPPMAGLGLGASISSYDTCAQVVGPP